MQIQHKLNLYHYKTNFAPHRAAGCTPFAVSIIGDYFPENLRGTAISIYYFGIYIGYSLAFAIGNGIVGLLSWRWVFFISGLIGMIMTLYSYYSHVTAITYLLISPP